MIPTSIPSCVWWGGQRSAWADADRYNRAAHQSDVPVLVDDLTGNGGILSPVHLPPTLNLYGDGLHRSIGGIDTRTQLDGGLQTAGLIAGLGNVVTVVVGCRFTVDGTVKVLFNGGASYFIRVVAGMLNIEYTMGAWFATGPAPLSWAVISAVFTPARRALYINGTLINTDTTPLTPTPPAYARFGGANPFSYGCEWTTAVILNADSTTDRQAAEAFVATEVPSA